MINISLEQVGWNEVKKPDGFYSLFQKITNVKNMFPVFSGTRIMMMPFYLDDLNSLPNYLTGYKPLLQKCLQNKPKHIRYYENNVGYLTIDEGFVKAGTTQRNPGKHVDGMYKGEVAGAWGGGGGGWGSTGNGMILVSNTDNLCSAWGGYFEGTPVGDGDCSHMDDQCNTKDRVIFKNGDAYWADGLCVHESHAPIKDTYRQFVRISMPSNSPWFVGYTENPLGIKPNGEIINEPRI